MTTSFEAPWRARLTRGIDIAMSFVALVAVVSLILEHGRYLGPEHIQALQQLDVGIIGLFVLDLLIKLVIARQSLSYLRQNVVHYALLGILAVWLLLASWLHDYGAIERILTGLNIRSVTKLYIVIIQVAIIVRLMIQAGEAQRKLAHMRFKPAHLLVASFLLIILIGTVLLYSPRATPGAGQASFIDSLFTATSATCVTGLAVRDTGTYFSPFGQGVILVLIQVGGLGLMTFAAFFAMVLGVGMSIRDRTVMQDVLNQQTVGEVARLIVSILVLTFAIEALGAALLYPVWQGDLTTKERLYTSVFHSVSCFCNAGFSLYSSSLMDYRGNVYLNFVVCLLIILGGLGFAVHRNLLSVFRSAWHKLPLPFNRRRLLEPTRRTRLSLHTRIVLVATVLLVAGGAAVVLLLEWHGVLSRMSTGEKLLASTFQSVTARTAGFNTIDTSRLSSASLAFVALLMFIGASPGSTGGGIKTATFAMLLVAVAATIRNRSQFEVFHRTVSRTLINRAITVMTVALGVVATSTILLCWFEQAHGVTLQQALFEVFSAFGTVGLSTGITPTLTSAGKIVIMLTMLVGRIGPLTLVLALGQREGRIEYDYPEENVMIG